MYTKEIARIWDVPRKEVLRYCKEGMVPTADKVRNGIAEDYDIPRGTPKPPCHRKQAILMIENIDAIKNEGANPWIPGFSYKRIIDCYNYFMDCGFISGFISPLVDGEGTKRKRKLLQDSLRLCQITRRGLRLISEEKPVSHMNVTRVNAGGKINVGVAEAHIDAEIKNSTTSEQGVNNKP